MSTLVERMVKACREELEDAYPQTAYPSAGDRDVEHLRWALGQLDDTIHHQRWDNRRHHTLTPENFFDALDNLAMGVPYPKEQWQIACREVV